MFSTGVMTYLYHGGSHSLKVEAGDVLELMAAANFFQLPGLLRYCEYRCSHLVRGHSKNTC
jgi:ankyrin repeat/BTB/POZ domain-containing protein 2